MRVDKPTRHRPWSDDKAVVSNVPIAITFHRLTSTNLRRPRFISINTVGSLRYPARSIDRSIDRLFHFLRSRFIRRFLLAVAFLSRANQRGTSSYEPERLTTNRVKVNSSNYDSRCRFIFRERRFERIRARTKTKERKNKEEKKEAFYERTGDPLREPKSRGS